MVDNSIIKDTNDPDVIKDKQDYIDRISDHHGVDLDPRDIVQARDLVESIAVKMLESDDIRNLGSKANEIVGPVSNLLEEIQKPAITAAGLSHAINRFYDDTPNVGYSTANSIGPEIYQLKFDIVCAGRAVQFENGLSTLSTSALSEASHKVSDFIQDTLFKPGP